MDSDSAKFLAAFNAIEQYLRDSLGVSEHRTFSDLVHHAGHSNAL